MYSSPIGYSHDERVRIAYHLRSHRERCGLTQAQVAERFGDGMTDQRISRYENAHHRPSVDKLQRFATIYGVDYSVFRAPLPDGGMA